MLKYPSPTQVALMASIAVGIVCLALLWTFSEWIGMSVDLRLLAIVPLVTALIAYLVFFHLLQRFIYRKIKLIYKTISDLKRPLADKKKKPSMKSDIIYEVEQEVIDWTDDKRKEIEQLRKLEIYRKEFLGNVSHELKTPVFNIQGYLETLLDGGIRDNRINMQYLKRAAKNVDRLSKIIEDLETISLIESGALTLDLERFNIVELADEVMDSLKIMAEKSEIHLGFKTGAKMGLQVIADREKIKQVYTNLITNSIKYGTKGGHTLLSFYDMDQNILCEVSDNGIGIKKEHLSRLFERFYRVDKARSKEHGGTGLGLSIVKHIIEAHRQTINIRSTPGIGTTFGFTLRKS
jgi:two-component system phosphate regulon sensor histidine kinase PhoR